MSSLPVRVLIERCSKELALERRLFCFEGWLSAEGRRRDVAANPDTAVLASRVLQHSLDEPGGRHGGVEKGSRAHRIVSNGHAQDVFEDVQVAPVEVHRANAIGASGSEPLARGICRDGNALPGGFRRHGHAARGVGVAAKLPVLFEGVVRQDWCLSFRVRWRDGRGLRR